MTVLHTKYRYQITSFNYFVYLIYTKINRCHSNVQLQFLFN